MKSNFLSVADDDPADSGSQWWGDGAGRADGWEATPAEMNRAASTAAMMNGGRLPQSVDAIANLLSKQRLRLPTPPAGKKPSIDARGQVVFAGQQAVGYSRIMNAAPRFRRRAVLFLLILVFGNLSGCKASASSAPVPARPNLIVILADDMGYSDPGCFGGEISTPALDRLAREGVRLTRFQNGGMCVVSRASMLTGQWWPRALKHFARTPLLPAQLHSAGYRTALIGKWHLDGHPLDRGFDHFFGFLGGFSDHFAGGKGYQLDRAPFTDFGTNYYSTDAFTDRAIQFIQAKPSTNADAPFFLYLSFQAPHNPLQAAREDILKYRGKYLGGWRVIREARFKRQKELGIVPSDAELPAYPQNLPDWNSLSPEQRDLEDLRMAVFAAMVERMDRGIGRLVAALRQSGQADNTLILFLSDNGADSFSVMDQAMLKQGKLPGDPGSNWQLGTGWAYASVTPWRLYKISQHAGGITTGAIAWSPGALAKPGRIEASPLHLIDVLPTFLELVGHAGGNSSSAPDAMAAAGESFVPLLKGRPAPRQSPLYFQYMDNRAIRTAEWTLPEADGAGWELFNAATDPLETRNLAAQQPEVVKDLSARWLQWWRSESGKAGYQPDSTRTDLHYKPQGDRGTGVPYLPSAMPKGLAERYPLPMSPGGSQSVNAGRFQAGLVPGRLGTNWSEPRHRPLNDQSERTQGGNDERDQTRPARPNRPAQPAAGRQ